MRTLDDIRELLAYNRWAHRAFFDAVLDLPQGDVDRELASSFPSIRATLAHMVGAELIWILRWEGANPAIPESWGELDVAALHDALRDVEARQDAFLDTLDPGGLDRELRYRDRAGNPHLSRVDHMLVHVVNHATYHRGQLATLLRQLGRIPPSTDFIRYTRRKAGHA
jgi:uncharacterized damage-inducible protein DinB